MAAIDDWLPEFDVRERHDVAVPVSPERALELALERFLPAHRFVVLARTTTEWVAGAVGAVWQPRGGSVSIADAEAWRTAAVPGTIKTAIDVRAERIPGGARLSTELRVLATDERARRAFRAYWLAVGPFSGSIRRRRLRDVQRAARTLSRDENVLRPRG